LETLLMTRKLRVLEKGVVLAIKFYRKQGLFGL